MFAVPFPHRGISILFLRAGDDMPVLYVVAFIPLIVFNFRNKLWNTKAMKGEIKQQTEEENSNDIRKEKKTWLRSEDTHTKFQMNGPRYTITQIGQLMLVLSELEKTRVAPGTVRVQILMHSYVCMPVGSCKCIHALPQKWGNKMQVWKKSIERFEWHKIFQTWEIH